MEHRVQARGAYAVGVAPEGSDMLAVAHQDAHGDEQGKESNKGVMKANGNGSKPDDLDADSDDPPDDDKTLDEKPLS